MKKKGNAGEELAAMQLRLLGFDMVTPVHNSWKVLRWLPKYGKSIALVVPDDKVEGDIRALLNGRSVLAEVKTYDDRLPYSALGDHQRDSLEQHAACGGLSLLIWIDRSDMYIMVWPVPGFRHRTSLKPAQAKAHAKRSLEMMKEMSSMIMELPY